MELLEQLRSGLEILVDFLILLLEGISIFCVLIGFIKALTCFPGWNADQRNGLPFLNMRLAFARWLGLALEFQLAADILATTVEPTLNQLIRLGMIAVIRTFLNYFLEKETTEGLKLKREIDPK
ncbi:MAG: DUF1622 domain-containing protein [Halothece sp. Uz-M2-17]|nr:DUF1622 domain-containing protein [Halothece sp. Uz-M2-17]